MKTAEQNENELYINDIVEKYINNQDDESLSDTEKLLLNKIVNTKRKVELLLKESEELKNEIKSIQDQIYKVEDKVIFQKGQLTGVIEALLTLKSK